jgi:mannonate dehydratase
MIQLSEMLAPRPEPLWDLIRQCGVDNVVATLNGGEQEQRMFQSVGVSPGGEFAADNVPWSETSIRRDVGVYGEHGFRVVALEDTPPIDKVRLGLPGRDEQIDNVITQLRAMGSIGIPVLCYNWMALTSWSRTDIAIPARGGALVTGFRLADSLALEPLAQPGEIDAEQLWSALSYFLDAVLPVAEEEGVRLALHPDDPPLSVVRGVPRIMSSLDGFRRLLSLNTSESNAVTFCQGNFALMTDDLPVTIREFGERGSIAFVHFRDVRGTADDFVETFHDDGQNDLAECMRVYAELGFSGPMRPDHVPTMHGETNERPSYGTLGRLFALGYIRGLEHSTYGRAAY